MRYHPEVVRLTDVLAQSQKEQIEAEKAERLAAQRVKDCTCRTADALSQLMVELRRNGLKDPIVLPIATMPGQVLVLDFGGSKATIFPILGAAEDSDASLTETQPIE